MDRRIAILGSGAMGTACGVLLSEGSECDIRLWARTPERATEILLDGENRRLLPGVRIPSTVRVTSDMAEAVDAADVIVVAIPTRFLRETLEPLAAKIP